MGDELRLHRVEPYERARRVERKDGRDKQEKERRFQDEMKQLQDESGEQGGSEHRDSPGGAALKEDVPETSPSPEDRTPFNEKVGRNIDLET